MGKPEKERAAADRPASRPPALLEAENAALKQKNRHLRRKVLERTWEVVRLNQAVEQGFNTAVQAMSAVPALSSHARRVAQITKQMAQSLALSERDLYQVEMGAVLHDIGKIRLPAALIDKADQQLTLPERAQLREHPMEGQQIVRMAPNLAEAAAFVRHHHERFDGKGYPDRLVKHDIPLGARLIAVASAYDRSLNMSPTPVTASQALQQVQTGWGTRFDPEVVEALTSLVMDRDPNVQRKGQQRVPIYELKAGMMLAQDLVTREGVLLLSREVPLERKKIKQLLRHHSMQLLDDYVWVLRGARQHQKVTAPRKATG